MGNKAGLFVNVAKNDSLANVTTFGTSIQQFVSDLLAPLVEITYAANFDQSTILPSGSSAQGRSDTPAGASIHPASSLFLTEQDFLNITTALVSAIPVESFPFKFSANQVVIVILLAAAIGFVIYFGLTAYQKEKSKIHD
jgi:large-conductance mechanosensitive channel